MTPVSSPSNARDAESTADAVLAEMVLEAPAPYVAPEAVAPRRVPTPTLVVSPGIQDDFAAGSGVEDRPAQPSRRAQLPPIDDVQPVGTVLQSGLFHSRRASAVSPAKPEPADVAPFETVKPERPFEASSPSIATPPATEPMAPVNFVPPTRSIDPSSEEIHPFEPPAAIPSEMPPDVVESLSATDWQPVDFGLPISQTAGEPLTNIVSAPVMPTVEAMTPVAMGTVTAIEPTRPPEYASPISNPLAEALQPGGTLLGAPVSAAGMGTPENVGVPRTPPSSPSSAQASTSVTVPASMPAPSAGLPTPLYTISIESLRRDLAAEAAAVSPELTAPVSHSAPVASGPSGVAQGGPQRLVPGAVPVGGHRQSAADPLISRALGFRKLGMDEQAITAYREALTLDPRNPVVKNNLADLLVERGENLEEAVDLMHEALQEEILDRGPYYSTLGWAYTRLGDYTNAEKFMNEALRAGVTAGRLYRRGRLYAAMGMVSRARADLDRALVYSEDAATSEMIRQALTELRSDLPVQGTTRNVR